MSSGQRNVLLLLSLVSTAVAPAFAQPKDTTTPPDLSGIWTHSIPGFEPLASGPTALINTQRRANGTGNILKLAGDYTNPILTPQAAEIVKMHAERGINNIGDPNPRNQCWPSGLPFVFTDRPTELLQQKDKVTIIYGHDHQVRQVRLNAQHPAKVTPTWYGDSVGHYEGDTLVVDTVGIKTGKFSSIDRFGTPYSDNLHVVERYRFIPYEAAKEAMARGEKEWGHVGAYDVDPSYRGRGLQLEFQVDDPGVFTMPWTATVTYLRSSHTEWEERACAENVGHYYELTQYYSDKDAHVPTAERPDF